jgi:predicted TIM-barrel fold metal-dependent hydrolase
MTTRRVVLGTLAAAAAAAVLPRAGGAQSASRGLIDVHHHHFPPALLDAMNAFQARHGLPRVGGPVAAWSAARSLEEMDEAGIRTAILSLASPHGVWFDVERARIPALSRACNEFAASLAREHPGRFGSFASLPMPDVDASLAEIAYALDVLRADGIGLPTSFGDRWPGDPAFTPLWAELDRRKAVVVFHPYAPTCCANLVRGVADSYLEYPYDTGRAILSLLFSGTLRRFRNVRWTFCHGGGALPALAGRVASLARAPQRNVLAEVAPEGVAAELKRLYYDTANATAPGTMAALLDLVPSSQVLFGTDVPYVSASENVAGLGALRLAPATVAAIERGNAASLIPRLVA